MHSFTVTHESRNLKQARFLHQYVDLLRDVHACYSPILCIHYITLYSPCQMIMHTECGRRHRECVERHREYKWWLGECGGRLGECGGRLGECGRRHTECGGRHTECGGRHTECGVRHNLLHRCLLRAAKLCRCCFVQTVIYCYKQIYHLPIGRFGRVHWGRFFPAHQHVRHLRYLLFFVYKTFSLLSQKAVCYRTDRFACDFGRLCIKNIYYSVLDLYSQNAV